MRLKETDELIEIWKRGNREEWSDIALEAVKELLLERLGELPQQELETDEEESEDEPLHNESKLRNISSWADTVSWVMLIGYILVFLGRLIIVIQGYLQKDVTVIAQDPTITSSAAQLNLWVNLLLIPVTGVTYFLILQAVSQGILMLMDMKEADRNSEFKK